MNIKNKKTIIILVLIVIILITTIILFFSYNKKYGAEKNVDDSSIFSIMIEVTDNNYIESDISTFPGLGYDYNIEKSYCINGSSMTWNEIDRLINLDTTGSDKCYVFFDIHDPDEYVFSFTDNYQEFVVPTSGVYMLEAWGAQGGNSKSKGAYTSGKIYLEKDEVIYVYVGEGNNVTTGSTSFNGGTGNSGGYPGGGATDFRLVSGTWNNAASLASRIMVAAGSGSGVGNNTTTKGAGGGLIATATGGTTGGTQTFPGQRFSSGYSVSGFGFASGGCAGGGGYYGGGGGSCATGSSGGSSFISGHAGSIAITSADDLSPNDLDFDIRYIEVGSNNNSVNAANHINEIKAFDTNGTNVALNKSVTSNGYTNSFPAVVDNNISNYAQLGKITTLDLGAEYNLKNITVWRYYGDNRSYYETYVKVYNNNKSKSAYLHNYLTDGTYYEMSNGLNLNVGVVAGNSDVQNSIHYSGKYFTDTLMIDGVGYNWTTEKGEQVQMPTYNNEYYALGVGHSGNGVAVITGPYLY